MPHAPPASGPCAVADSLLRFRKQREKQRWGGSKPALPPQRRNSRTRTANTKSAPGPLALVAPAGPSSARAAPGPRAAAKPTEPSSYRRHNSSSRCNQRCSRNWLFDSRKWSPHSTSCHTTFGRPARRPHVLPQDPQVDPQHEPQLLTAQPCPQPPVGQHSPEAQTVAALINHTASNTAKQITIRRIVPPPAKTGLKGNRRRRPGRQGPG